MTPEVALKNLDAVCANFQGTRDQHVALQMSIEVIQKLVEAAKNKTKPAEPKDRKQPDGKS